MARRESEEAGRVPQAFIVPANCVPIPARGGRSVDVVSPGHSSVLFPLYAFCSRFSCGGTFILGFDNHLHWAGSPKLNMRTQHTAHSLPAFPVYSSAFVSPNEFVLGGGGGQSKTGIKNKIVRVTSSWRACLRPTLQLVRYFSDYTARKAIRS